MSDTLLTREEYGAIAADLVYPAAPFIDGRFRAGTGKKFPTINPSTGETITKISGAGKSDVDHAVKKAREAFEDGRWSRLSPADRKHVLIRLCKLLTRNLRELAVMESVDSGKPIADCEQIDLPGTIEYIKWHAEAVDKIYEQVAPPSDDHIEMIIREAVGVVASVFTSNTKNAIRAARELRAGAVSVNCYSEGDITTPFGGYKHSGSGGRDNGIHAHDQYTELKTIWIDLSDNATDESVG